MIEMYKDELKATREEIKEIRNQRQQQPSALKQIEEITTTAAALGLKRAGDGGGEGSIWGAVLEKAIEKFADPLTMIASAWASKQATPGPDPWKAPQPGQQQQAAPQSQTQPAQAQPQQNQPKPPEANLSDDPRVNEEKARLDNLITRWGAMFNQIAPHMIDKFKAKETGYDFRDWFLNRYGLNNWTNLREELGFGFNPAKVEDDIAHTAAARLIGLTQTHPVLKTMCVPIDEFGMFALELFTAQGEEPEGTVIDDDTDGTPSSTPPQRTN
jgi:hypothetical protein